MTERRDPDHVLHAFILEGAERLDDRVYDAVRAEIDHRRQRAVLGSWRLPSMNRLLPIGLAAAVLVVVVLVGSRFLPAPMGPGGDGPIPSPTVSPTALPTPTSTPAAGLPEGPFGLIWDGLPALAPRITVTIPAAGWTGDGGILMKGVEVANLPEAAIISFSEVPGTPFYVYGDPCRWESSRPETPATTVSEIAAALATQASREASTPVDVTVGGYAGKAITLHVPADANPGACEGGEFASFGTASDEFARYHQGPGQIDDLWIIDVDGAVVIIDAMYRQDTPPELIAEMRSIAESATFVLP